MIPQDLERQLAFIKEIDKVKSIFRQSRLMDNSRYENDAEHSWHLAMMAVVLFPHANHKELDLLKVVKMVLIHDLVEIDAGDAFLYDPKAQAGKRQKEVRAAERIFGLLPAAQKAEMIGLWEEFEARQTPEARFARALDRLEPLMQNYLTGGYTWKKHDVRSDQVLAANKLMEDGSTALWEYIQDLIAKAVEEGKLKRPDGQANPPER